MAIAPLEHCTETTTSLGAVRSQLVAVGQDLAEHYLFLSRGDVLLKLVEVEELSKVVDHLQILVARAAESHDLAGTEPACTARDFACAGAGDQQAPSSLFARPAAGDDGVGMVSAGESGTTRADEQRQKKAHLPEYRSCADFLRARLGISRSEANRRLRLAAAILPAVTVSGAATPALMGVLGAAAQAGRVSGRAISIVHDAVQRVRCIATPTQLESMEHHLTRQAVEADEDVLRVLARRWENVLDQDGQEPTEKVLRARQGVFLKGRRNGLQVMEIGATDEQFEHLVTVMNTATNPRTHPADSGRKEDDGSDRHGRESTDDTQAGPEHPTRPQSLLDGLVAACRIALSTEGLPAAGGHRPQVMVTITYQDLVGELDRAGHAVFGQQLSARSIRLLACDADIIPMVLGGQGQILDVGRAQRLFPAHMRRALVARDKGCAFPDCSIPATWCEAHHIVPWSTGGTTTIDDGVLLCGRHHHVIHDGHWTVHSKRGIPWFRPPRYRDPRQTLRRNTYWQVEQAVRSRMTAHP